MKTRSQSKKTESSPRVTPVSPVSQALDENSRQAATGIVFDTSPTITRRPRARDSIGGTSQKRAPRSAKKENADPAVDAAPADSTAVVWSTPEKQPSSSASAAGLRTPYTPRSALRQRDTPSKGGSVSLSHKKNRIPFTKTSPSFSISRALLEEKEEESASPMQEQAAPTDDEKRALPVKTVVVLVSDTKGGTLMFNPHAIETKMWGKCGHFEASEDDADAVAFIASRKMIVNGQPLQKDQSMDLSESGEHEIKHGQSTYKIIITDLTPVRLDEDEVEDWNVGHLKMYLETRSLSTKGNKAALIDRLRDAIRKENEGTTSDA